MIHWELFSLLVDREISKVSSLLQLVLSLHLFYPMEFQLALVRSVEIKKYLAEAMELV